MGGWYLCFLHHLKKEDWSSINSSSVGGSITRVLAPNTTQYIIRFHKVTGEQVKQVGLTVHEALSQIGVKIVDKKPSLLSNRRFTYYSSRGQVYMSINQSDMWQQFDLISIAHQYTPRCNWRKALHKLYLVHRSGSFFSAGWRGLAYLNNLCSYH